MAKRKFLRDGSLSEASIQRNILEWLKDVGLLHWRQNSGNVFAGNRKVKLGESGLPDIILVTAPMGRIVGLEVKSRRGKLRPCQIEFCNQLTSAGGLYFVVRSLEDAMGAVAYALGKGVT